MSPVALACGLAAGLVVIAVVCWAVTRMIAAGSLPRNGFIGIRTHATQRSDAAWSAGHEAARRSILAVAVLGASSAVATVVVGIALRRTPSGDDVVLVLGMGVYALVLGVLVRAARKANRAASAAP